MALRPGKIYSKPKGYKAFLTNPVDEDDRGKRSPVNRWGASLIPSGYKPGVGAPRAPVIEATETKEDMDARREAIDKWASNASGDPNASPSAEFSKAKDEVLAAVASHGTVEASQRGMYSGRTVQAPSPSTGYANGFEPEGGGLTDRQKEGIEKSVNAEIESRMEAKQTGATYTGAHSAEEQRQQNLDYQNALVKQFGEAEAKERLGDRWVGGVEPTGDKDDDEPAFGLTADAKGGQTAADPVVQDLPAPEQDFVPPDEFSPLFRASAFDDPAEAARAIVADPGMDYPDLVDAAAAVAAPDGTEPEGYDPDAVFRGVLERRIVSDLFASLSAARQAEQASADYYHGSNARSVTNACGASPDEYALALELSGRGDPSALLRMQMKFMDSF